jgi:voltage-dependent calcium channel alpha-2/delta-3
LFKLQKIAQKVQEIYDKNLNLNMSKTETLYDLGIDVYKDADVPKRLPQNMEFNSQFKQKVSFTESIVKISDEIPRNDPETINAVLLTKKLDDTFISNYKNDPLLKWQYFGSSAGILRVFPAREWDTNFAGFYNDFDPRIRNWYIAATSGPKDVVIVLGIYWSSLDLEKV